MKKIVFFLTVFLSLSLTAHAQKVALKNNLLFDATTSLNLAVEVSVARRSTIEVFGSWNPFVYSDRRQFRHWLVQPEYRFWTCESFNGLHFGVHALGGEFNVGGLNLPFGMASFLKDSRYTGHLLGGGLSVGYQWVLSKRWNLEASVGAGVAYIYYDRYEKELFGGHLETKRVLYTGPTRASLSFVFFFN